MSRPMVHTRRPGLRGVWLMVLAGWLALGIFGGLAIQKEYEQAVVERGDRLLETADYALESRKAELARIARILALDERVRDLLSRAKAMVALEGGGGGGEEAAQLRRDLAHAVTPIATELIHGEDRVLQFHLGPDAISFLRVHAPDRFGDELASLRPLLANVYRRGEGAIGFEIGRVYSGFRAVEPVWAPNPAGSSRVVGTVEVGTGIAPIDSYLSSSRHARAALLLPAELAEENMWAEVRDKRDIAPVGSGEYYLDGPAVDHPGLSAALGLIDATPSARWQFAANGAHWVAVSRPVPVVGQDDGKAARVVAVESITNLHATMESRLVTLATAVIVAIALTTLALWLLSRWQRTRWMVVVDQAEAERDALFELSPQPLELTDMQGRSLLTNEAFRRTFGPRDADEPLGWESRGLTGLQLEAFERAIAHGERWNGALKLPALHGGAGWFRVQVVPIRDESGGPGRLWWFFQDVDRERRAAAVAQAERDRLDAFLAASPAVIYTYLADMPDRLEYVSANIEEILGYTPDALIDGPDWWEQTLHPADRDRALAEADFSQWSNDSKRSRYRLLRPDGSALWVTDHARLLRDESGRPERVVGALIDSRETVALEAKVAESERLYRSIVEGVEEAIFLVRVEPDGVFRYLASNPSHERATGLARETLAGATPEEMLSPENARHVEAQYRQCLEAGHAIRYRETLDLPAGRTEWRTTLTPIRDETGRFSLIAGVAARIDPDD
ncbi:PAS domain-containing protein [Guyparkeria hydrothermalis]|uniref:PAS domain-containing protein n=1 Tax=Guyparkeria hydrothermalis TaxID=923 RepID=UPI00202251B7|nr:PAS domain-containing protein [Guyparkeria hydrothermalis]MCL7744790.1 PAS domain-containing protein [Guyparkeria hydrothermalis]